jgi:hypothetical protein
MHHVLELRVLRHDFGYNFATCPGLRGDDRLDTAGPPSQLVRPSVTLAMGL